MTIQKIEFTENQTRVYVKVQNKTNDSISIYSSDAKLIVGNKQLEADYSSETGLPELQPELLAGVESEGVIVSPAIDINTTKVKLNVEGYSDNYDIELNPFTYE